MLLDQYNLIVGQNNLVLIGTKWKWVSKALLRLYILKKVEIWSDVTIAGRTNDEQGKIGLLSQWTMDG